MECGGPVPLSKSPRAALYHAVMRGPFRRLRKPLAVFGVVALLIAAPFGVSYLTARAEYAEDAATLPAESARARKLGLALIWEELTPDWAETDANAAPIYEKAFAEQKQLPNGIRDKIFLPAPPGLKHWDDLRVGLEGSRAVLVLVDHATARPRCWFIRDRAQLGGDFSHLPPLKDLAKLVCRRAEVEAHEGRLDAALESLRVAATIARHSGEDPGMIGWLVKGGLDSMVLGQLNLILVPAEMTPPRIELAREVLATLGSPDPLPGLRGELVERFTMVDRLEEAAKMGFLSQDSVWERVQGWWEDVRAQFTGQKQAPDLSVFRPRFQDPKLVDRAYRARELHRWNAFFEAAQTRDGDPQAIARDLAALRKELDAGHHRADRPAQAFPYLGEEIGEAYQRAVARRRLAKQALTVMGFRQRTGNWPATLADAGDVLADPFDGKPLRYRVRADGFVVYSIGTDLKDDGGGKNDEVFAFPVR